MTQAPPGRTGIRRPKTRQEVREDIIALTKRLDVECEEANKKWREAIALRDKFEDTRLADFKMPAPSPPQGQCLFLI